ncbi:hypothetical protein D3C73_1460000 [compost metagenome]
MKVIESKQTEVVKNEIEDVIKYSKEKGIDLLNMSSKLYHKSPIKWDKIKDNWSKIYETMKIDVKVKSNVNRTYHIKQKIKAKSGG